MGIQVKKLIRFEIRVCSKLGEIVRNLFRNCFKFPSTYGQTKHIWPTYDTLTNMDGHVKYYREVLLFRDKKTM